MAPKHLKEVTGSFWKKIPATQIADDSFGSFTDTTSSMQPEINENKESRYYEPEPAEIEPQRCQILGLLDPDYRAALPAVCKKRPNLDMS